MLSLLVVDAELSVLLVLVTVVDETELVRNFIGEKLSQKVELLTVERKKQWDWTYKSMYYEKIIADPTASIVKIFDKLDNLFILSENNDVLIKKKYLQEIVDFLYPIVDKFAPNLSKNFKQLVTINLRLLKNSNKNEVKNGNGT